MKIEVIKRKFKNADYPPKFVNSVINQFLTPKNIDSSQVTSVTCFALEILIPASKDKRTRKNLKARTRKNVFYCNFKTII